MGLILDAQDCLVRMLSRCYALQNWNGTIYPEAQLLARIYAEVLPVPANGQTHTRDELEALRPFIVVGADAEQPIMIDRDGMGGGTSFNPSGALMIMIEQAVALNQTESQRDRLFYQLLEGMLYRGSQNQPGLLDQLDQADSINIKRIACQGVYRIQPEEIVSKGDAQRAYFRVEWGSR